MNVFSYGIRNSPGLHHRGSILQRLRQVSGLDGFIGERGSDCADGYHLEREQSSHHTRCQWKVDDGYAVLILDDHTLDLPIIK